MAAPAALEIHNPSGGRRRVSIEPLPFHIGRHDDNHLVLRDNRVSRRHARILAEGAGYVIEDLKSTCGLWVNGARVARHSLRPGDSIGFGVPDSYRLVFSLSETAAEPAAIAGGQLAKLRAVGEVTRALAASLSIDEVLAAVIEGALAVTGCERGFLLLRRGDDLEIRVARDRHGPLSPDDLRIPTRLLGRALARRKEFLAMDFDPAAADHTIAALELRSVICVPLVRVRAGAAEQTAALSIAEETAGLLYLDSRLGAADLSGGGREILTTLALEASTVLENARLLEERWKRQRMEEELRIARQIQQSLLPRSLPADGWFRAAASSLPSLEVGGDYLDVRQVDSSRWSVVVADVSGKGVGAALLASLLHGLFLAAPYSHLPTAESLSRVNRFLNERTGGEQYATLFHGILNEDGLLNWSNAGHPAPLLLRAGGRIETLPANGLPLGLLEDSAYDVAEARLSPGEMLVIYSDGVTEARNAAGEFFGLKRLKEALRAGGDCRQMHATVLAALRQFTGGAPQADDVSLVVLEYRP